jgi:hypothetical protein
VHYVRSEGRGGWLHGFNKDFIFSFRSAGYVDGWNGDMIRIRSLL